MVLGDVEKPYGLRNPPRPVSAADPVEGNPMLSRSKASLSEDPASGSAGEPNERRDPASSYVCREAEDLCRDDKARLPSPGLLESRPGRLTPSPQRAAGRESSSRGEIALGDRATDRLWRFESSRDMRDL